MHTEQEYRVYAMGFAPGFAYLGELPEKLRLPRLDNPRTKIPAGSVAIAEAQTAVYPSESPGGWNIIGRTAETLYDPQADSISPMKVGDRVQFKAVSKDEFEQAGGSLESLS
jgi:KipI family sensor histidine kinase inhibitor